MFFFEQTFQTVLNGIDGAFGPMAAITNIANAILLLCALFAVYEAYARGGDARMIGIAAARFLLLGLILSNYDSIFRSVMRTTIKMPDQAWVESQQLHTHGRPLQLHRWRERFHRGADEFHGAVRCLPRRSPHPR